MCSILNGINGPIANILPTYLSSVWFPANERTTSTAVGTTANMLGVGVSFILGDVCVCVCVCVQTL